MRESILSAPAGENTFARAKDLFVQNPILALPGVVIAIVIPVINLALTPPLHFDATGHQVGALFGNRIYGAMIALVVWCALTIGALAFTTAMAGTAWKTGKATLDDGIAAFGGDAKSLWATLGYLTLALSLATIIAAPTIGLSFLAAMFFGLYSVASTMLGRKRDLDPLRESFEITIPNLAATIVTMVLLIGSVLLASYVGSLFRSLMIFGPIVAQLLAEFAITYFALVITGDYMAMTVRRTVAASPAGATDSVAGI